MLKAAIPVFFCLASGLSHAGWVQLGTFDNPNLASSVVLGCQHRIVNNASRVVYIYPTIFTPTQSTGAYDFHAPTNPTMMQRMLLTPTGVDGVPMRNTLKQAYDYLHEGVGLEENKIRESYFTARIIQGTSTTNRNKIYVNTSFFSYSSENFTPVGAGFEINAMYYPYFALQQLC